MTLLISEERQDKRRKGTDGVREEVGEEEEENKGKGTHLSFLTGC